MRSIEDILADISSAVYGRDVRNAIVEGIRKCYDEPHIVDPSQQALIEDTTARATARAAKDMATENAEELKLKLNKTSKQWVGKISLTSSSMKIRRLGGVVTATFTGVINVKTANHPMNLGTIPNTCRPQEDVHFAVQPVISNAPSTYARLTISADSGKVTLICSATGSREFHQALCWWTEATYTGT